MLFLMLKIILKFEFKIPKHVKEEYGMTRDIDQESRQKFFFNQ